MKSQLHKARIVIPQLIKKINSRESRESREKQSNKQNICSQNMSLNNSQKDMKVSSKKTNGVLKYKMKISQYMNQSVQQSQNEEKKESDQNKKITQIKTSYSTDRTCQQNQTNLNMEEKEQQNLSEVQRKEQNFEKLKLSKLSSLLTDNKMFINPDKWAEFTSRAMSDQQFHKALNAFMYSYFIQHYN